MSISTLTSKGQVTIPKDLRDRLRLRSGDRLDFRAEEDGSIRIFPITRKVSEVFGVLSGKAAQSLSEEDINSRLRRAFREGKL